MPEGHTLHRLARDQQELVGRRVAASSPQGRFAEGAARIDGRAVEQVGAVGKHLLQHFDGGLVVHTHLGMRGKALRFQPVSGEPLRQVRLRLHTGDLAWDLIAPATCELLTEGEVETLRSSLGPDPLAADSGAERAIANLRASGRSIGEALLDQSLIAGVGNVFRAEGLLRARLHPATPAAEIPLDRLRELWDVLQRMMRQAVDDAEIRPKLVYKQPVCLQCATEPATPVLHWDLRGRTAYACPSCQPAPAAA
ncbi:MAG: Endonuclease VIII [uncultured Acidimicrobiales bacterium]|uniref:DNA-(apurinic or apyrimidinic site) lyase n=1 Tax=uncultured Acidimicrobiales bacterium TaxID=310071 RepID=A0A6J4H4P7_9ACTN|nr:MAG: Endonuclease VIII [uncultured Acidimicrobiales bacterium]